MAEFKGLVNFTYSAASETRADHRSAELSRAGTLFPLHRTAKDEYNYLALRSSTLPFPLPSFTKSLELWPPPRRFAIIHPSKKLRVICTPFP